MISVYRPRWERSVSFEVVPRAGRVSPRQEAFCMSCFYQSPSQLQARGSRARSVRKHLAWLGEVSVRISSRAARAPRMRAYWFDNLVRWPWTPFLSIDKLTKSLSNGPVLPCAHCQTSKTRVRTRLDISDRTPRSHSASEIQSCWLDKCARRALPVTRSIFDAPFEFDAPYEIDG